MRHRLGDIAAQTQAFGERLRIGDATVSFHPAGHLPGSAQIRVSVGRRGLGRLGRLQDHAGRAAEPFEPVRCHAFVSECTFGLPVFKWRAAGGGAAEIERLVGRQRAAGPRLDARAPIRWARRSGCSPLVDARIGPILTHGAVEAPTPCCARRAIRCPTRCRSRRKPIPRRIPVHSSSRRPRRSARPGRALRPVLDRLRLGLDAPRGVRRRRAADRGFVLSDHADWPGLHRCDRATEAGRVFVTHGYTDIFARWLNEAGYDAASWNRVSDGEEEDAAEARSPR